MSDLISRNALLEYIASMPVPDNEMYSFGRIIGAISLQPAVDAVPVVRCKDCLFWKPSGAEMGNTLEDMEPVGGCKYVRFARKASDYCSFGER